MSDLYLDVKPGDVVRRIAEPASWAPVGFSAVVAEDRSITDAEGDGYAGFANDLWEIVSPPDPEALAARLRDALKTAEETTAQLEKSGYSVSLSFGIGDQRIGLVPYGIEFPINVRITRTESL